MRIAAVSGIGLLALALAALPAQADVIRISMQPSSAFGGRSPLDFTGVESAAAAADPLFGSNGSNTWNYITAPPSGTSQVTNPVYSSLLDSAGLTTGVSLSFTGTFDAASDNPLDNNGSNALQNEYFLIGGSTVIDFTISGLAPDTREALYFYAPNFTLYDSGYPDNQPSRGYQIVANGQTISVASG